MSKYPDIPGIQFVEVDTGEVESLRRQLAECQAYAVSVRCALEAIVESAAGQSCGLRIADEALTLPHDSTALDEAINQAKREVLEDVVCDIAGCDTVTEAQVYIHGLIEETK